MEISYLGHSCFKIKSQHGTIITDPYQATVGFDMPNTSADIVTISHDHSDHNAYEKVKGTARREKPFLIDAAGEYEVGGISIFGVPTFHDTHSGSERGRNIIFVIYADHLRVCHLGDLGHELTDAQKTEIGQVDVLLVPVGGKFTINAETAVKLATQLDPSYVIPMHYKTELHNLDIFADLQPVSAFLNEYGVTKPPVPSLTIDVERLPEETEVVVLER